MAALWGVYGRPQPVALLEVGMRAGWGTLTVDARPGAFKPAGHTGESGIKVNVGASPFKAALKLAAIR